MKADLEQEIRQSNRKFLALISQMSIKSIAPVLAVIGIGLVGSYFLVASNAATPAASVETESGTVSSAGNKITDTTASGNSAVKFGQGGGDGGNSSGSCPPKPSFPDATCTGVPAGASLTAYTGPTSLPCGTVIDSKLINSDLEIAGGNGTESAATPCVTITRSKIVGTLHTQGDDPTSAGPLVLTDVEVAPSSSSLHSAIVGGNIYLTRVNVHNGVYGGIQCDGNCVITDSWTHDFIDEGGTHYDGIGTNGLNGKPLTVRHSSIGCNFVSAFSGATGGCSADLGLFGDFSAIGSATGLVTIDGNLFLAASGVGINADPYRPSYCATTNVDNAGKTYPFAYYFTMSNNVFQRGPNNSCGQYGAVGDWTKTKDASNHNSWTDNTWDDGTVLAEPN